MKKLEGKVAVVTGGSSGIGEAVCLAMGNEGAKVSVVASSELDKAALVSKRIVQAGGAARPFVADVRSVESIDRLVAAVLETFDRIDILVNSAGVYFPTPVGNTSAEDYERMVDVNFKGPFFAIGRIAPLMIRQGGGKIVNVASVAAYLGRRNLSLYCAVKAGIVMMTRAMAIELAPHGVNINAVAPGNTATPINEHVRHSPEFAERLALIEQLTPSKRKFSGPAQIAEVALFLASAASDSMHGATILADEGLAAGW